MSEVLPSELYSIIISDLPFEEYPSLRLICQRWGKVVEESEFGEVLRCVRVIRSPPIFVKYLQMNNINFQDGSIQYNTRTYGYDHNLNNLVDIRQDYGHNREDFMPDYTVNARIKFVDPLQIITNNHGTFKLSTYNNQVYLKINENECAPIPLNGKQPYIISSGTEVYVMNGDVYKYDGQWTVVRTVQKEHHVRQYFLYKLVINRLHISNLNNTYLGSIYLPTLYAGMGPNYIATYTNKLEIRLI